MNSTPSTSSFPSGHTAAATVLFVGIVLIATWDIRRTWVRVLTIALAVIATMVVGFGRVYRGMHHPTDVTVGALLGVACLTVAILAVPAWERGNRRAHGLGRGEPGYGTEVSGTHTVSAAGSTATVSSVVFLRSPPSSS